MPTARITQNVVEVLVRTHSKPRVTQTLVEVLVGTYSKARLTQTAVEVLISPTTSTTTSSTTAPPARVAVEFVEVLRGGDPSSRVAVEFVETLIKVATTTTTVSTTTSTTIPGSVVFGHDTSVDETFVEDFQGKWEGSASIEGSGDSERLVFEPDEEKKLITPWLYGVGQAKIYQNKYQTGDNVSVYYRTGSNIAATQAKSWSLYTGRVTSEGYVDVRLIHGTLSTTTSTTTTSSTTTTTTTTTVTTTTGPPGVGDSEMLLLQGNLF